MINLIGLLIIALIVWWFWLYHPKEAKTTADNILTVTVEQGIYQPSRIKVRAHEPITLAFIRKEASPCAETLLFPTLDISETLPLNNAKTIKLPALTPGSYPFHCQMQMYRGELYVE